jgi:hypothetical protein
MLNFDLILQILVINCISDSPAHFPPKAPSESSKSY